MQSWSYKAHQIIAGIPIGLMVFQVKEKVK
jgi:hypothetical protein